MPSIYNTRVLISFTILILLLFYIKNLFAFDVRFDGFQKSAINELASNNINKAREKANQSKKAAITNDIIKFVVMDRSVRPKINNGKDLINKYRWLATLLPNKFDKIMNTNLSYQEIKNYYDLLPQKTALSRFFLYEATIREQIQQSDGLKKLELLWTKSTFPPEIENYLICNYVKYFQATSLESKIRTLLMNKRLEDAKNLITFLPNNKKLVYKELIRSYTTPELAKKIFISSSYPIKMVALYFYIKHLNQAKLYQKTYDLLLNANYTEFAVKWWQLKNIAIRNALREKKYQIALNLAKSNQVREGPDFFESEWLAGFITFRMLNNPRGSLEHFHNIFNTAKTSYSKAQGAYWLGRAYEAIGNKRKNNHWHSLAVRKYPHFFYGQLSSLEINTKLEYRAVLNEKRLTNKKLANKREVEEVIIWAKALYKCGFKTEANKLANHIINLNLDEQEIHTVLEQLEEIPIIVAAAKQSANSGYTLIKSSYPLYPEITKANTKHQHSLYLSIIRQESGFDHEALSLAGARGLMQLMPKTAEKYAKQLGFKKNNYDCDAAINISIGICYLDKLMELWNNNYIMAIASYNAGENAVARWLNEYGDPRTSKSLHQNLDWLELMPYGETRLYVKKVLENIINYNFAIHKKPHSQDIIMQLFGATYLN